jgi:hypothetical protein
VQASEGHFAALEGPNLGKVSGRIRIDLNGRFRFRIRSKVKSRIRVSDPHQCDADPQHWFWRHMLQNMWGVYDMLGIQKDKSNQKWQKKKFSSRARCYLCRVENSSIEV